MTFTDVVFPHLNEVEFQNKAMTLGISKLCFVYPYKTSLEKLQKHLEEIKIPYCIGIQVPHTISKQEKTKLEKQHIILFYKSDEYLRKVVEQKLAHVIYNIEDTGEKEHMHHRNAGMNQVIAKLLHQQKIIMGVSFAELLDSLSHYRAKLFGRIMQNATLQKKYNISGLIGSFATDPNQMRGKKELQSVLVALGYNEKDAKEMFNTQIFEK